MLGLVGGGAERGGKVSVILVCFLGGSTPTGFNAALEVTSAKVCPNPLPLAFPPLAYSWPVLTGALSASPPLRGGGILGWLWSEGLVPAPRGWLSRLTQVAVTAGESTLVTGCRGAGREKGVTGGWHAISRVLPGFHLPFSKGHGIRVGSRDFSSEESRLPIGVSSLWGREEGVRVAGCGRDIDGKSNGGDCIGSEEIKSGGNSPVKGVLDNEVMGEGTISMVCIPEGHRGPKERLESGGEG